MAILFSVVSLLIAALALALAISTYIDRNRPFVGVKSLNAERSPGSREKDLLIEVQNVGELPAVNVAVTVTDSGGSINDGENFLGAISPDSILSIRIPVPEEFTYMPDKDESHFAPIPEKEGVREYIQVYPEGYEATLVTCTIAYQGPPCLDSSPAEPSAQSSPFTLSMMDGLNQLGQSRLRVIDI